MAYTTRNPLDSPDDLHIVVAPRLACSLGEIANTYGRVDEIVDISVANTVRLPSLSATKLTINGMKPRAVKLDLRGNNLLDSQGSPRVIHQTHLQLTVAIKVDRELWQTASIVLIGSVKVEVPITVAVSGAVCGVHFA